MHFTSFDLILCFVDRIEGFLVEFKCVNFFERKECCANQIVGRGIIAVSKSLFKKPLGFRSK